MDKPTAIIFIGIQGSGKSTFYHRYLADSYVHINLDTLRTRKNEQRLLEECIVNRNNVVIDNTNPTAADRARYIAPAKAAGYRVIGFFFESKLQPCIRRNAQRTGKAQIPAKAIAATSNKLELPSIAEGFDALYFVKLSDEIDKNTGMNCMMISEWRGTQ